MYRIALSDDQRHELRERTHQAGIAPSTRDRLEMVRLCDAGWSVPRIARHWGQHEHTVRAWIKALLSGGFEALPTKPRGGKQSALTAPMLESVRAEVATGARTWTAAQLADWIAAHRGVRLSADRLRRHLRRAGRASPGSAPAARGGTNRTLPRSPSAKRCSMTAQKEFIWRCQALPRAGQG